MYHKVFTQEAVLIKTFGGIEYLEEWRPVKDYEGLYEISSFGRVKSLREEAIMKQYLNEKGYLTIGFHSKEMRKKYKVHRLVAIAFHLNPENKPEVNHDDFDKTNNFYKNLIWATQKENTNHAQNGGRRPIAVPKPFKMGRTIWATKVLDTSTGIIYDSVYHLCKVLGLGNERDIRRKLGGERRNNTTYKFTREKSKFIQEEFDYYWDRYLEMRQKIFGAA